MCVAKGRMFPYVEPDNSHLAMDDYKVSYYGVRNYDEGWARKPLTWRLNHFLKRLNKVDDPKKFIHLVSQLQLILTQIDCIHKYDFAADKLLLSMAGDFSPLLNHLNKRTKRVYLH